MFACAFFMVFHLMVLLLDDGLDMNRALQQDAEGKEYRKTLYSNPGYVNAVQKFIKYLSEKDVLVQSMHSI